MNKRLRTAPILVLFLISATLFAEAPASVVLNDLQGEKKTLNLQSGKPSLLVFFASWCAPCKKEAPHLVEYQNSADRRCNVIGINVDKDPAKGMGFVDTYQLNYPVLSDPALHFADQLNVRGTPAIILLDGKGNRLYHGKKFDQKLVSLLNQL